jgi:hypothetical protein
MKNPTKQITMLLLVCTLLSFCFVYPALAQSTLVKAEASASQPHVGDTLTVNIKISNVQNLYGVDVTLKWNTTVLNLISATPKLGVESNPEGILHESSTYPIEIIDNTATQSSGEYHLLATSTGSSTPAFTGSGTIATVTFTVTTIGSTELALNDVEIAIKGNVDAVTPSTSVDSVNPVIPEFPTVTILIIALVAVAALAVSTKMLASRVGAHLKKLFASKKLTTKKWIGEC